MNDVGKQKIRLPSNGRATTSTPHPMSQHLGFGGICCSPNYRVSLAAEPQAVCFPLHLYGSDPHQDSKPSILTDNHDFSQPTSEIYYTRCDSIREREEGQSRTLSYHTSNTYHSSIPIAKHDRHVIPFNGGTLDSTSLPPCGYRSHPAALVPSNRHETRRQEARPL